MEIDREERINQIVEQENEWLKEYGYYIHLSESNIKI